MQSQDAIDLGREALLFAFQLGGPILLVVLAISLLIGLLQGMTQLQDGALSFIPKVAVVLVCLALGLPWLGSRMIDYTKEQWQRPINLSNSTSIEPR
jgi:flagellar biosynthetic protein FliQ